MVKTLKALAITLALVAFLVTFGTSVLQGSQAIAQGTEKAGAGAGSAKASALSWQKQARDTRATVMSVVEELNKLGDQGNPTVKDLINDAGMWVNMADQKLAEADKQMKEGKFDVASSTYNMAWQYYVKAATAGLNAKRILTGK